MMQKKNPKQTKKKKILSIFLQQYLLSIDAKLLSRNSTVSVKAETAESLVAWDSIIEW